MTTQRQLDEQQRRYLKSKLEEARERLSDPTLTQEERDRAVEEYKSALAAWEAFKREHDD